MTPQPIAYELPIIIQSNSGMTVFSNRAELIES